MTDHDAEPDAPGDEQLSDWLRSIFPARRNLDTAPPEDPTPGNLVPAEGGNPPIPPTDEQLARRFTREVFGYDPDGPDTHTEGDN